MTFPSFQIPKFCGGVGPQSPLGGGALHSLKCYSHLLYFNRVYGLLHNFKREHVQMSASGRADTNQLGADSLQFHFWSVLIMFVPRDITGQTSSRGQLTEIIKSWLIPSAFIKGLKPLSLLVTDKNYIRQWLRQQKQRVNDWVFNAHYKRGWVRPTVYCHIAPCLSKVCIVSKNKISDKCLHSSLKISYGRQYQAIHEEFLYQIVSWRNSELLNNAKDRNASLSKG